MPQREAAAAAGRLEHLLEMIGHLRRGPRHRPRVAGREQPAIVKEFVARDLGVRAQPGHQLAHEPARRCLASDDLAVQLAEREALRQL